MFITALLVVLGYAASAILLGWVYFRHYQITRPPIGVFNLRDIAIMIGGIILVPYLYLGLPHWLVAGLLTLGAVSALYFMWEPVLRPGWAVWLVTFVLAAADIGALLLFGATSSPFFVVNDVVQTLVVVGLTNLWAQSGMKARDVALLAGMLAIYDIVATWLLPLMTDLFASVSGLPFAPLVAWPAGGGRWVGIGLGDLLLAAVFPLVMRKAFDRAAGLAALTLGIGALAGVLALPALGLIYTTFPVMIVLGPLTVGQYLFYRRRFGSERTTQQYLQAEPARE